MINRYSAFLQNKYGERVYKIPINLNFGCPNRDGVLSSSGCLFCSPSAIVSENLPASLDIAEQCAINKAYIGQKYHAKKFIAYFQSFSNTYCPPDTLWQMLLSCAQQNDIVEICLSTRPDCISPPIRDVFRRFMREYPHINLSVELGLQSVNPHTLKKINRGHTLAEFIEATLALHALSIPICAHLILNLPWDDDDDAVEAAKILSALAVASVKVHSLAILKNTELGALYERGEIDILPMDDYVDRAALFLAHLSPDITVQRLTARFSEGECLFCNWGRNWRVIDEAIVLRLRDRNLRQGDLCNYLAGGAWQRAFPSL